jgi:DNA-binding NarL/FixJ family response regulator
MTEFYKITILDVATGKSIERPFTAEEIKQFEIDQAAQKAIQAEQEAKLASRESALAKLAALGLTEDEIAAL